MKIVHVAAGIIVRDQQVFISKRSSEQHQGNKWEFPGGKVESGESVLEALTRELKEEVNLDVLNADVFHQLEFDYGDKIVQLDFYLVDDFVGVGKGLEGQQTAWVNINALADYQFPEANQVIVEMLMAQFS
ncbi:8-oxo-dGTP diphosphatase MutT [Moritella sp. F3]|uniref:8-oxo-dGTP diphosphatase MutT n=1 Tax=Moritella sp. F3 TaxID=2718882 RepID=UPI0018E1B99C|nr:8-oxo-dGTP diphosphatase MutT [Moritella sp. F3]GIC76150.1 7,8-dihydro-8-oxoguanine-triphosphatase [Moritella sp. F1]GIC82747.1 7,8-dihydro-8-oxoguanine-triphosphatase [Moritella sp. F3]